MAGIKSTVTSAVARAVGKVAKAWKVGTSVVAPPGKARASMPINATVSASGTPPPPPPSGYVIVDSTAQGFGGRTNGPMTQLVSHEVTPPATYTIGPVTWANPPYGVHYFYTAQTPTVWNGCLCFIKDDISLQTDSRYGKVYRVACTTGDTNQWQGNTGGNINGGAQLSYIRDVVLETWNWYAFGVRVDSWNLPVSDIAFCEVDSFGYQTSSNSQVAISLRDNGSGALWWSLYVNAGYASGRQGWVSGTTHIDNAPFAPVTFGVWEEFIVGVKWSTHTTGAIDIRHRIPSQSSSWSQVYNLTNIDTELWGPIYDGQGVLIKNFAQDASNWPTVLDRLGLYFGHNSHTITTETILHTGFVDASDLATAMAKMPA